MVFALFCDLHHRLDNSVYKNHSFLHSRCCQLGCRWWWIFTREVLHRDQLAKLMTVSLVFRKPLVREQFVRRWSLIRVFRNALVNDCSKTIIFDPPHSARLHTGDHFAIHLPRSLALLVRRSVCTCSDNYHLQQAHAKSINVNSCAVLFFIDFWRNEIWSAHYRCCARLLQGGGQAQIANQNLTDIAVDENVVALQVPVDDRLFEGVQIRQAFQNLSRPCSHHLFLQRCADPLDVRQQGSPGDSLCDEAHLVLRLVEPSVDKGDDPRMLQRLEHVDLLRDAFFWHACPCPAKR
mmetsp:Transcript_44630/g.142299  ORF Transcript_44630/g.142299 Transcript_44630/m.142299 type:complete len:293 (-) Transcript_44630:394-1272(-)